MCGKGESKKNVKVGKREKERGKSNSRKKEEMSEQSG